MNDEASGSLDQDCGSSTSSSPSPSASSFCHTHGKKCKRSSDTEILNAEDSPKSEICQVSHNNQSWQETKKTIKERTSHLVNSQLLSDVIFLVGQDEVHFYGHKTILSAGSPYFESLFFGPMAPEGNSIKITELDPEIFLIFLKYLYTDEFDTSMDDVKTMQLLHPAKMYLVPHLVEKCTTLLKLRISPENVLTIYNRALLFDENTLADFCLRFLDRQIDKVIASEAFLEIDVQILSTLLERQNLRVDECTLFNAVYRWSEMECLRREISVNPENRRIVLGSALNLIRFPTLTQQEFSLHVVPTHLLTKDEVIGVYMNMCIGDFHKNQRPETPFSIIKRVYRPRLHYVSRFLDVLSKVLQVNVNPSYPPQSDLIYSSKLNFKSDQRIFLHGVGVYGISSSNINTKFNVSVYLFKNQSPLASNTANGTGLGKGYDFRKPFVIEFEKPSEIQANEEFTITATLKVVRDSLNFGSSSFNSGFGNNINIDSYYGSKGQGVHKVINEDGALASITFITPLTLHAGEVFSLGQIPQIIISF